MDRCRLRRHIANYARFTIADLSNRGVSAESGDGMGFSARSRHYSGKAIVLEDEITQSHLEFAAMALRRSSDSPTTQTATMNGKWKANETSNLVNGSGATVGAFYNSFVCLSKYIK